MVHLAVKNPERILFISSAAVGTKLIEMRRKVLFQRFSVSSSRLIITESIDRDEIRMSEPAAKAMKELREWMFKNVYTNPKAKSEEGKAQEMITMLYDKFSKYPELMPDLYIKTARTESPEIAACDFVAGMTDRYAVKIFNDMFVPKGWANI